MSFFIQNSFDEVKCIEDFDKLTLTDCLACSGCITADEESDFASNSNLNFLNIKNSFNAIIISPQSLINIYQFYNIISFDKFEEKFIKFVKKEFNLKYFVNSSYFNKNENKDVSNDKECEIESESTINPIVNQYTISSECPAIVLYVERVFPKNIPLLSTHKTYQQIAGEFIHSKIENGEILSIAQCYDKKMEFKRDLTNIKYFLGTKHFFDFIKNKFDLSLKNTNENTNEISDFINPWEYTYKIINKQNKKDQKHIEINGLENSINFLKKVKNSQNLNENIELRACKGGCLHGHAQINFENINLNNNFGKKNSVYFKTTNRKFITQKKKTFAVNW